MPTSVVPDFEERQQRAQKQQCVTCGKNIGMNIEFGGNPEVQVCNMDGDGFVCSKTCKEAYDQRIRSEMNAEFGGSNWGAGKGDSCASRSGRARRV